MEVGVLTGNRYKGPSYGGAATSVAVSPNGDTVFVTGASTGKTSGLDYATVAYNAATGAQLWVKRYNGPGNGLDQALSLAVSPAGETVFVTGYADKAYNADEYTTIAYNATTGATRWLRTYIGPDNGPDIATKVAVSPSGNTVFVTGWCYTKTSSDFCTIAYNAATGARVWLKRYASGTHDASLAVGPGGSTIYVTGLSYTIAYDAATGAQLWVQPYNGGAASIAVNPVTGAVYVTGDGVAPSDSEGYLTIAYSG